MFVAADEENGRAIAGEREQDPQRRGLRAELFQVFHFGPFDVVARRASESWTVFFEPFDGGGDEGPLGGGEEVSHSAMGVVSTTHRISGSPPPTAALDRLQAAGVGAGAVQVLRQVDDRGEGSRVDSPGGHTAVEGKIAVAEMGDDGGAVSGDELSAFTEFCGVLVEVVELDDGVVTVVVDDRVVDTVVVAAVDGSYGESFSVVVGDDSAVGHVPALCGISAEVSGRLFVWCRIRFYCACYWVCIDVILSSRVGGVSVRRCVGLGDDSRRWLSPSCAVQACTLWAQIVPHSRFALLRLPVSFVHHFAMAIGNDVIRLLSLFLHHLTRRSSTTTTSEGWHSVRALFRL